MIGSAIVFRSVKNIHSIFLVAIFATFGLPTYVTSSIQRVEPSLQQQIHQFPDSAINIIIQKDSANHAIEQYIAQLGGEITKDLTIINALAVKLPAHRITQLSQFPGVRWISPDAAMQESGCKKCASSSSLQNDYIKAIQADRVWNKSPALLGKDITVAVVDSGIKAGHPDLANRVIASTTTRVVPLQDDFFGHGTFVAGIIAGNGTASQGAFVGVAPQANLVNVKVAGVSGEVIESDVIEGLQWIYENRTKYNIRVVNLSLNGTVEQSYHNSPIDAACEILWFNGIVVVVSAGNNGDAAIYPPANDPFVITVGAADGNGTPKISDDSIPAFSANGITSDGVSKPDLVAPGRHLVGPLASKFTNFAIAHPANVVNSSYFMMSGTSASAPVVSGAVALLLQADPKLTPDQVKYRLMSTANRQWAGYDSNRAGAGYLDILAAINNRTKESANTGTDVSNLLTTGPAGILSPGVNWSSVSWNSVSWNSVSWNSVSWNSVSWNSVSWNSDYWEKGETLQTEKKLRSLPIDFVDTETDLQSEESNATQIFLPFVTSGSQ